MAKDRKSFRASPMDRKRKEQIAIYAAHAGLQARMQVNKLLDEAEERKADDA